MRVTYIDRRKVYHDGRHLGDVAQFGEHDFRASSHAESKRFASREEAESWLSCQAGRHRMIFLRGDDDGRCELCGAKSRLRDIL